MPYIKKEKREKLDRIVSEMWVSDLKVDGDLNYILYAFCKRCIEPSYNNYKNFCGELRQCATEIERRMLAKYEDEAIIRNGDVD
jgi:ribosomal protein L37E